MSAAGNEPRSSAAHAADAAEELSNTTTLDVFARVGFAVLGLIHILIGAIALRIALGGYGEADPAGAVEILASRPVLGPLMMWTCFASCLGLALWQLSEASLRARHLPRKEQISKGISSGSLSVTYALFAFMFARFALGDESDSGESTKDFTIAMLRHPLGVPFLLAVGGTVIGIGIYFVVKALRRQFTDELDFGDSKRGRALRVLGVAGHIAKGVALFLVGLLIIIAGVTHRPSQSTGLDGSLKALPEQPFGIVALVAIAVGLMCYGVFAIIRARYGRM
ncbi:DUF1206 domain-containing protein [Arthrobacter crystallopoietes]|uniref:DUF1206 domain-containing protein n=1 Tax=Crystallibacter crystallopoietes TaxID=37928 RepID=UPI001ABE59B5|nr:DUF1206 domain-containing protein [Arthrobacter crystallopoietes]QTG81525.1 DUF1206 domain-containing protein [Arthrobacter crystallopoietes]